MNAWITVSKSLKGKNGFQFGNGPELEKAASDNSVYLFIKIKIWIKNDPRF